MTHAIKKVIEACEKDPACSQNYPDLENRFLEVLDSLNKEPIKIEGFSNEPIMVDAQVFVLAIFAMIYTKDGMEVLPMLVEMTEQGNDWIFRPLAQSLLTWPIENDMLKIISMNDRATFAEPTGSHSYEDPFFQAVYQYCYNDFDHKIERIYSEILELTPHPYDTTTTVYQTPVLLFDGFYDPVTPPIFTDQVAGYFPNHISFTVADRGHDASGGFEQIIPAYISNPGVKPDLAELQGSPNFEFAHDIILNSGISSLAMKIATGNYLTTAIILGIVLLLLVIGFLYFPIRFIVKKVGKKPVALPITITLSTWLIAFFSIVFLGVLALAVSDTLSSNMYLLAFGLPGQWWILFIFPWLVLIALLVSLYFYQKYRPIGSGNKIFWSLSWFGGLGFLLFFWVSGVIF